MTTSTLDAEPACPGSIADSRSFPDAPPASSDAQSGRRLIAVRRPFDSIEPAVWNALAARTPWATPFALWAFHRAWWDAYGDAHEQTLVVVAADAPDRDPVAIVPLMHRHEVEPNDAGIRTQMRHAAGEPLTPVAPTATAVFFGATYHADYATVLTDPADLPAVARAVVAYLVDAAGDMTDARPWDVVDLRRLRCGDPAADALADAFRREETREHWHVTMEREDVCPVVTLGEGMDYEGYLATLGKKERHEIRRKVRRAEAAGPIALTIVADPLAELPVFIDLHQKRWGDDGLFPETPGGDCSRRFFAQLFRHFGPDGPLKLARLTVGDRTIAEGVHFDDGKVIYYYNAGVDPEARELSPGVVMAASYMQLALGLGRSRVDFLRGDEPYKYEWGALDEPIQRLLVTRDGSDA